MISIEYCCTIGGLSTCILAVDSRESVHSRCCIQQYVFSNRRLARSILEKRTASKDPLFAVFKDRNGY